MNGLVMQYTTKTKPDNFSEWATSVAAQKADLEDFITEDVVEVEVTAVETALLNLREWKEEIAPVDYPFFQNKDKTLFISGC